MINLKSICNILMLKQNIVEVNQFDMALYKADIGNASLRRQHL